jgi:hypothetical protein
MGRCYARVSGSATEMVESVGGSSKGEGCASSKGENSEGVKSEDFGPEVERRGRGLSEGPERSERVVDQGEG